MVQVQTMPSSSGSFLSGQGLLPLSPEAGSPVNNRYGLNQHHERELQRRVIKYEKEFNINLTRLERKERELKDSMVAYSDHMTALRSKRSQPSKSSHSVLDLQVRARHIPKRKTLPRLTGSDVMSVDDVKRSLDAVRKNSKYIRSETRKDHSSGLPPLSKTSAKGEFKMSYVSASDLFDMSDSRQHLTAHAQHLEKLGFRGTPRSSLGSKSDEPISRTGGTDNGPARLEQIHIHIEDKSSKVQETANAQKDPTESNKEADKPETGTEGECSGTSPDRSVTNLSKVLKSEKTLEVVQEALRKLQAIEAKRQKTTKQPFFIKRSRKKKRFHFPQRQLSAIPEHHDPEDSGTGSESTSSRLSSNNERGSTSAEGKMFNLSKSYSSPSMNQTEKKAVKLYMPALPPLGGGTSPQLPKESIETGRKESDRKSDRLKHSKKQNVRLRYLDERERYVLNNSI